MARPGTLKKAGIAGGLAAVLLLALWFSLDLAVRHVLGDAGVRWRSIERDGLTWRLNAPRHAGWQARGARVELGRTPRLLLSGLDLDLQPLASGPGLGAAFAGIPGWLYLGADPMTLRWGETPIASGMRTRLQDGALVATGPTLRARGAVGAASTSIDLDGTLELAGLRGSGKLRLTLAARARLQGEIERLQLEYPQLTARPLQLAGLRLQLEGESGSATGTLALGSANGPLRIDCPAFRLAACSLDARLDGIAAQTLIDGIGNHAWLRRGVRASGTVDLHLALAGGKTRLLAAGRGLRGRGTGIDAQRFDGSYRFRAGDAGGGSVQIESGPGSLDWLEPGELPPGLQAAIGESLAMAAREPQHIDVDGAALEVAHDTETEVDTALLASIALLRTVAPAAPAPPLDAIARDILRAAGLAAQLDAAAGMALLVNAAEWAPGIHGLRGAARHYFDSSPADLEPRQVAFLAALLPAARQRHEAWFVQRRPDSRRIERMLEAMSSATGLDTAQLASARRARLWFE